jgi:hypothetical protein
MMRWAVEDARSSGIPLVQLTPTPLGWMRIGSTSGSVSRRRTWDSSTGWSASSLFDQFSQTVEVLSDRSHVAVEFVVGEV